MPRTRSYSVPDSLRPAYESVAALLDPFCAQHLNDEYAQLSRELAAALARKRPSPLARGKPEIWACGIAYAIGTVNFLFDQSQTPHMRADALCGAFGVSQSSASNKARLIREMFGMSQFDPNWCLPSLLDQNPMVWMLQVNGLMVDVRDMPREVQETAFKRGLIPYIPADRAAQPEMAVRPVEPASLQRYRQYRTTQVALNNKIVKGLARDGFDAAVRGLGVGRAGRRLMLESEDEISVLMDYAIHEVGAPGARVIDRYRDQAGGKDQIERELLDAAAASAAGIYRVQAIEKAARQLALKQLAPVERDVTLLDISFSQSSVLGALLFTRLLELPAFTMTGGAALVFEAGLETQLIRLWAQAAPRERYRWIFKLHRRSGIPIAFAGVGLGRRHDQAGDEPVA